MIDPARLRIMSEDTIWVTRKVPVRLMRSTDSQSSSFMRNERPSFVIPALFTSIEKPPEALTASVMTGWTESGLPISAINS